jgi:hypothetical protein
MHWPTTGEGLPLDDSSPQRMKAFLGCLNCSQFDSGSVCNQFGESGSQ